MNTEDLKQNVEKALDDFSSKIQENPSLLWTFMVYLDKLKNSNSRLGDYPPTRESVEIFINWYYGKKGKFKNRNTPVTPLDSDDVRMSPLFGCTNPKDYIRVFGEKIESLQEVFNEKERIINRIKSIRKQLQDLENPLVNISKDLFALDVNKKDKLRHFGYIFNSSLDITRCILTLFISI